MLFLYHQRINKTYPGKQESKWHITDMCFEFRISKEKWGGGSNDSIVNNNV